MLNLLTWSISPPLSVIEFILIKQKFNMWNLDCLRATLLLFPFKEEK